MTPEQKALDIVVCNGAVGDCTCDLAYSGRGRTDPGCAWCNWGHETAADIAVALREARAEGMEAQRKHDIEVCRDVEFIGKVNGVAQPGAMSVRLRIEASGTSCGEKDA